MIASHKHTRDNDNVSGNSRQEHAFQNKLDQVLGDKANVQSYPGYPYLGYPKPRLSEHSSVHGVCLKKMVFSLKSQTLRLSRVHVFVYHTYMFNVGTQWYVIVYSVKCKGLQTRPSYIFFMLYSMYIAWKVSFGLSEQFHLSEQPIKPLCAKVFR